MRNATATTVRIPAIQVDLTAEETARLTHEAAQAGVSLTDLVRGITCAAIHNYIHRSQPAV